MRKYHSTASVSDRVEFFVEVAEGLGLFQETAELAPPLLAQNEELERVNRERIAKERLLLNHRTKVRFADFLWDTAARSLVRAAEIKDGGIRGTVHAAIFPDGIGPVVVPSGGGQVAPARAFITALKASKAPGVDELRTEWLPKLEEALAALEDAVNGRTEAYAAVAQARAVESAACDDHELALERVMGQIRAIFPKDRRKWNVIFPSSPRRTRTDEEETELDTDVVE
jgi:hypothetical protein